MAIRENAHSARRFCLIKGFKRLKKPLLISSKIVGAMIVIFLLINAILFLVFINRTYPRSRLNNLSVGNLSKSALQEKINAEYLLPTEVTITVNAEEYKLSLIDAGIIADIEQTTNKLLKNSWLPLLEIVRGRTNSVSLKVDEQTFKNSIDDIAKLSKRDPIDARIGLVEGSFSVIAETPGYQFSYDNVKNVILDGIVNGQQAIEMPLESIAPKIEGHLLMAEAEELRQQQAVEIAFVYGNNIKKPTASEKGEWYIESASDTGNHFVVSQDKIKSYLISYGSELGINIKNLPAASASAKTAMDQSKPANITLEKAPDRMYQYCTAVKGVDSSFLTAFRAKVRAVFGDGRGWASTGVVGFEEVNSGCDFTVWLTAANFVPGFNSYVCDSYWSCQIGSNVIINFDRWQSATDAWNAANGGLDEYRSMVINHETGHWLGYGHRNLGCSNATQLAPIMQQQSMDLRGCQFNAWPTADELRVL